CGYNMADYWEHWLELGEKLSNPPKIFRVNWFRTGDNGKFLWPGYGENLRVLEWIIERCTGSGEAERTFLGWGPTRRAINRPGMEVPDTTRAQLLQVDRSGWVDAVRAQAVFCEKSGDRLPERIQEEHVALAHRVSTALQQFFYK